MTHQHHWVELRRQIPWLDLDFDPDVLAPERARYEDGKPHSDKDHADKVAKPRPEIVFVCPGCTSTKPFEIPVERYKEIIRQLESGGLSDSRAQGTGPGVQALPNDITLVPLAMLVPEAVKELSDPKDAEPRSQFQSLPDGSIVTTIGLSGKAAEEADARYREAHGFPPVEYVHATHPADRKASK